MLDCSAKLSSIWEVEGHFLVVKKLSIYVLDILGLPEKLPEPLHPDSVTPHETLMLSFLSSLLLFRLQPNSPGSALFLLYLIDRKSVV